MSRSGGCQRSLRLELGVVVELLIVRVVVGRLRELVGLDAHLRRLRGERLRRRFGGVVALLATDSISTCEATISVFQWRILRSSSHWRVWSRPSIATSWPLPRYWAADLGQAVPGHHVVELGLLLATAVLVGGDAELGDVLAVGDRRASRGRGSAGRSTGRGSWRSSFALHDAGRLRRRRTADGPAGLLGGGRRQRRSGVIRPGGRSDASSARSVQMT